MSRLNEIIDNHDNLDQLFSIIKHYGVNAQFVSDALYTHFESRSGDGGNESGDSTEDKAIAKEIMEDLKQFSARF